MKLYIANCSKMEHLFAYMLPENPKPFHQLIRAGAQIPISGTTSDMDAIIKQHVIYGMQEADKVTKGFGGLCYRIDKPISISAIEAGLKQRDQEAIDAAQLARAATVAAQNQIIETKAAELGLRRHDNLEVEVLEEKRNEGDTGDKMNEITTISHSTDSAINRGDNKPRRGRPRSTMTQ